MKQNTWCHLAWRGLHAGLAVRKPAHCHSHLALPPQGRPVYIQHLGAIKVKQLAEITTEDRMIRFHVQACGTVAVWQHAVNCFILFAARGEECWQVLLPTLALTPASRPWPCQEYERCLKYIFPSCSKKAGKHIDQTFAIMDVKVGWQHAPWNGACCRAAMLHTEPHCRGMQTLFTHGGLWSPMPCRAWG